MCPSVTFSSECAISFLHLLEKELSFYRSLNLKIEICIYFSVFSNVKCRYLSGIKMKHTKAPVSLCFATLEQEEIQSELNPGILQSGVGEVDFSRRLMSIQRCYDNPREALLQHCLLAAQLMHLRSLRQPEWHHVTVKDNQRQSMGQCWKKKDEDQSSNCVTFIPALPKKNVCFMFARFPALSFRLCKPVTTCHCRICTGEEHECLFLMRILTDFFNVAVTLQSKSFKRKLM